MRRVIVSLLTEQGAHLPVKKRMGAIIDEVYRRQDQIEALTKGRVEITIDCANSSVIVAVREVGESRKIE